MIRTRWLVALALLAFAATLLFHAPASLLYAWSRGAQPPAGGAVLHGVHGTLGAGQSLLAVVDQSRKASALTKPPSRLQPEGDGVVRIWLEDVPFDALLRWLADLQLRYGVRVDTADIERESAPGLVNARVTLMR